MSPATGAGVIATEPNTVDNPVTILFGDSPAEIQYAGLAPNFVGLYQFNVRVPSVTPGDWPLRIQVGGQTLAQTMYTATQQKPSRCRRIR